MDGWMDGWVDGWMDVCMFEKKGVVFRCSCFALPCLND